MSKFNDNDKSVWSDDYTKSIFLNENIFLSIMKDIYDERDSSHSLQIIYPNNKNVIYKVWRHSIHKLNNT